MSAISTAPVLYNSIYYQKVDEKRRVQIPHKWRPAQDDFQFTLILWPRAGEREPYLLVLPPDPMQALIEKLKVMPYSDAKADSLRRLLGKNSDTANLDSAGRICVPEAMAKGAGLERDAVLIGSWDRFEIWSPSRYEKASQIDDALAHEAFKLI